MSKSKTMSISFKKDPRESGLRGVAQMPSYRVKVNKKVCGRISMNSPYNRDKGLFSIGITIKKNKEVISDDTDCDWQWLFFKNNCQTEDEAKAFITKALLNLPANFTLHFLEN